MLGLIWQVRQARTTLAMNKDNIVNTGKKEFKECLGKKIARKVKCLTLDNSFRGLSKQIYYKTGLIIPYLSMTKEKVLVFYCLHPKSRVLSVFKLDRLPDTHPDFESIVCWNQNCQLHICTHVKFQGGGALREHF